MFTIPNGQIVKSLNLSKDWARAVVDIPVPTRARTSTGSTRCCTGVAEKAMEDASFGTCCWTRPQLMGVESIELDTVNLRMVARTLPGKQFEVGRRLRVLVVRALRRAGIASPTDGHTPMVGAIVHPATAGRCRRRDAGPAGAEDNDGRWFKARLGRMRVSTIVLIVAFLALFWVYHNFEPRPAPTEAPDDRGGPARLRARPELHLGAADQRPAAEGT